MSSCASDPDLRSHIAARLPFAKSMRLRAAISFAALNLATIAPLVAQEVDDIGAAKQAKSGSEMIPQMLADKESSVRFNDVFKRFMAQPFEAELDQVVALEDSILVSGRIPLDGNQYILAEAPVPAQVYNGQGVRPVRPIKKFDAAGRFLISFPRHEKTTLDRLYSRWMVVRKDPTGRKVVSHPRWTTNLSQIATFDMDETRAASIKGTDDFAPATFEATGAIDGNAHTKINILLDQLIRSTPTSLVHEHDGRTYYLDPRKVAELDEKMRQAAALNLRVAAVLLISRTTEKSDTAMRHPDAALGPYAMANVSEMPGVRRYAAVIDFLARRYAKPTENGAGRIAYWIVHNEVDAHRAWTHAGFKPVELYTEIYMKSMRVAYLAIRQHDPLGRVYASFTHHWNSRPQNNHPDNFKPREMLGLMKDLSDRQGDFEWGVAFHPYPANLRVSATWNDSVQDAGFSDDAAYITPRNVEQIDAYMRRRDMLYNDARVRPLIFSEQGIGSNPDLSESSSPELQAAGIAYFWAKSVRLPTLEAIHYHRLVDHPREGRINFGLYTNGGSGQTPGTPKPGLEVWDAAGTDREDAVFAKYLPFTGLAGWADHFANLPTEVTPYHVELHIAVPDVPEQAIVGFSGQNRITPPTGVLNFYNVASDTPQPLTITIGSEQWATPQIAVSGDCRIDVTISPERSLALALPDDGGCTLWPG